MMVVLDTNFLTLPTQFKIDIFGEIKDRIPDAEFATVRQVEKELERLGKIGKISLAMLKKFNVRIAREDGETDDALLNLAFKNHGILCTNDRELKKRALGRGVPVMFMRKKKTLEIMGGLDV